MVEAPFAVRERENRRCVLDEVEHAVLNTGLDQRGGFVDELLAVAHKREQHADGQVAGDAGAGAEIDHQDIAGTLDQGSLAMRKLACIRERLALRLTVSA